jgi:phosphoglycerol transferase MdoB-like AlkP superfamily enzyme
MNNTYIDMAMYTFNSSKECAINGGLSDQCLYEKLCPAINHYFQYYNIGLLVVGIIAIIGGLIVNRTIKDKDLRNDIEYQILFYYVSMCIMYLIVNIYFNGA